MNEALTETTTLAIMLPSILLTAFLLALPSVSQAAKLSWPVNTPSLPVQKSDPRAALSNLATKLHSTSNGENGLQDCLAIALPDSCQQLVQGHDPELARMQLAAKLAVCELQQASLSIPSECSSNQWDRRKTRSCVESLARCKFSFPPQSHLLLILPAAPQNWSSYSGYLREIGSLTVMR